MREDNDTQIITLNTANKEENKNEEKKRNMHYNDILSIVNKTAE